MLPRWGDLLILDEAHNVAPSSTANYVKPSIAQGDPEIVQHFEHKLFLTATPHNGYQDNFTALLEMLDDQRFARGVMPTEDQLHEVMIRRAKSELKKNWDGSSRFPERNIQPWEADYSEQEIELPPCSSATSEAHTNDDDTTTGVASGFVLRTLSGSSSPQAFAITLQKHHDRMMGLTDGEDDRRDDKPAPLKRFLQRAEDEVSADDDEAEENLADTVDVATEQMTLDDDTGAAPDAAQGGRRRRQPTRRQGQGTGEVARCQYPSERPMVR